MRKETQEKAEKLQRLFSDKERIEAEIERLLMPETIVAPPSGFNLHDEIERILSAHGGEYVTVKQVVHELMETWGELKIPRRKVNASLVYLKRKARAEGNGEGSYRAPTQAHLHGEEPFST